MIEPNSDFWKMRIFMKSGKIFEYTYERSERFDDEIILMNAFEETVTYANNNAVTTEYGYIGDVHILKNELELFTVKNNA